MNIAILVKVFPPSSIGGTEIATLNIAKRLGKKHVVNVITIKKKGLPEFDEKDNFKIKRLSITKIPIINNLVYFFKTLSILKNIQPDILHAQMLYSEALFGVFYKNLLKIPLVVSPRGSDILLSSNFYKNTVIKFIFNNSDHVLAQTANQKNEILKITKNKVSIIQNGVDILNFFDMDKLYLRNKLGLDQKNFILIFVGRLIKIKGVEYLIKAFNNIEESYKNVKLLIIGDGDDQENLKNISRDLKINKISFLGLINPEEIPKYLTASDLFILPSLSEGFPMTILEAFAAGLPVIASDIVGIPEIMENEKNGYLVEPKNSKQIKEKIIKLIEDKSLRLKIKNNNIKKAGEYSWDNVIEKLEHVYLEMLKT